MKNTRLYGWLLTFALAFFASACEKEDSTPTPDPTPDLQTTLAGKYWESNAYFLHRSSTGEETVDRSTLSNLRVELGAVNDPRTFLGVFYCAADLSSLDKYLLAPDTGDATDGQLQVYRNLYELTLQPETGTLLLTATDPAVAALSIYNRATLTLRTLAADRIEFDMALNDYVRSEWATYFDLSTTPIVALRVVWTPVSEERRTEYHHFDSPVEL